MIKIKTKEEIIAQYGKRFETHKAELIQNTDRFCIIDWQREDKSIDYYINFIIDKKRGSLIISGDLGNCIATWYNALTPEKISKFIYNDIGYFMSKFQCSSDEISYDTDIAIEDMQRYLEDIDDETWNEALENNHYGIDTKEEYIQEINDEINNYANDRINISPKLENLISELYVDYSDYAEWLYNIGSYVNPRVYLWAYSFHLAITQLKAENKL